MTDANAERTISGLAQDGAGTGARTAAPRQAEGLARMTAQFRALHDIDVALTSSLQLDRVLSLILEKAVHLVGAEHGSLRLLNPETGDLELKAFLGEGWTPEVRASRFPVGYGITGWAVKNRRSYLCSDAQHDPQYVVLFQDMRSSVAVPLAGGLAQGETGDQILGVLLLESARLAAFDDQDVELLEALAQEAVIAILNATQHQRLQAVHQALQGEQARRVAAEKWAVMGQAATALAHRINNLIGIVPASAGEIRSCLAGLQVPPEERAWIEANLERIERNAQFILKMANALFRPFQETGPRVQLDVNRMLSEALQMASLPPDVQVNRELGTGLPAVESNLLLLDIFLELITNARRAMAGRPEQCLAVRSRWLEDQEGSWVVVEIEDTGTGISPEDMAEIWKMFKSTAEGLGFGLWWVRTFIEQQGGTIACHSEPGTGTTFTIHLPGRPRSEPDDGQKERECEARF
ncbi:MAG TPA: ATP-binding protein [Anaerolineae bacterium]|nr:ATP-binding protein [Anaerolineae bacterium]